jgi:hypothetical protein
MNVKIDVMMKRARGYWFVDGFTEMAVGGLFILVAGILLVRENAPRASFPSWFLSVAGEVSIVKFFGILVAILALWWLKDRFTYPRTGFVRGNRVTAVQILIIIRNAVLFLFLPIFVLLAASLLTVSAGGVLSAMPAWFPIGLGLIWAVLCFRAGAWMGLRRFQLIGVMVLLTGIIVGVWQFAIGLPNFPANAQLGILQPPVLEIINQTLISIAFLTLTCGVILTLSGFVAFVRYRKENPTPYNEAV